MKKVIQWMLAGVAIFVLSGCGGIDDGIGEIDAVDIMELYNGYVIDGESSYGDFVTLEFCENRYTYYKGDTRYDGDFDIDNGMIVVNMYDDDGGSYVIDTMTGYFELGEYYDIFDVADDITVSSITRMSCP